MSEQSPKSIKDLVERVPDGKARRTFQALVARIDELEKEVQKRDEVIRATHGFLRATFRTTYDSFRQASSGTAITATASSTSEDAPMSDQDELTSARARDDFFEVCRRAFKIVETTTYGFLTAAREADGAALNAAWDEQQSAREARQANGPYPHKALPLPPDWRGQGIYVTDLIETAFLLLYGDRFRSGSAGTEHAIRNLYFTILTVREVRNAPSHGQEDPNADAEQVLSDIKNVRRCDEALKYYQTRNKNGYDQLIKPVFQYEEAAHKKMAAWASTTEAAHSN